MDQAATSSPLLLLSTLMKVLMALAVLIAYTHQPGINLITNRLSSLTFGPVDLECTFGVECLCIP